MLGTLVILVESRKRFEVCFVNTEEKVISPELNPNILDISVYYQLIGGQPNERLLKLRHKLQKLLLVEGLSDEVLVQVILYKF